MERATPRLVGREDQLCIIDEALARLCSGHGSVLSIVGAAGTGKTALLDTASDRASASGTSVRRAVCEPDAEGLTSALDQLVDGDWSAARPEVREAVERLSGPLPAGGTGHDLIEMGRPYLDGLVSFFETVLVDAPLLVVLDDAQWADEATLGALRVALRRLEGAALTIVVAARPALDDRSDPGRVIAGRRAVDEIVLDDLEPPQGDELLARLVSGRPGSRLTALARRAAGNPLLLVELVRSLQIRGRLEESGDTVELADEAVDDVSLDGLIARQLGALSGPDRELLRTASLLGRAFAPRDLSAATGSAVSENAGGLERLLRAGLLVASRDDLSFRHDLVRHAVYETIPAPLRIDLHRELADRLVAAGAPSAVVAPQYLKGARAGDGDAVAALRHAAREAMPTMPRRAGRYLERARELVFDENESIEIEAELGWARFWAGEVVEAERILSAQIARLDDCPLRLELTGRRAQTLFVLGRLSEASEVFDQLAEAGGHRRQALYRADAALTRLLDGHPIEAAPVAAAALDEGRSRGDLRAQCQALGLLGFVAALQGHVAEGIEQTSAAVELAEADSRLLAHRDMPYLFLMQVLTWADRHDEALAAQRAGLARSEQIGASWHVPVYLGVFSDELARAGRFDDALTEAAAAVEAIGDTGAGLATAWPFAVSAHVLRRRGDLDRARRQIDEAFAVIDDGANQGADVVLWELGLWQVDHGEVAAGRRLLRTLWRTLGERRIELRRRQFVFEYVRVLAAHDPKMLAEAVADVERWSGLDDAGFVAAARFTVGVASGDPDTIRAALAAHDGLPRPLERAAMYEELAVLAAVDDRRFAARSAAAEAVFAYEQAGATADVDRLRRRLGDLGLPLGPGRPARPVHGWESLTPSETAVVRLVAKGATNAAIAEMLAVSRRTVESHLHHVYRKVDCESRVELALAAAAILDDAD